MAGTAAAILGILLTRESAGEAAG